MRSRLSFVLLTPLLALSLVSCGRPQQEEQEQEQEIQAPAKGVDRSKAGQPMPVVEILNSDVETATLIAASGQPVVVNLWASWCAPCVKELPTLDSLSRRKGAPRVIAVSEEMAERASVDAFLEKHGIANLESWRDPNMSLSGALGVQVMPTTIYYDASGRELWRYVGDLDWTGEEAAKLLADAGRAKEG